MLDYQDAIISRNPQVTARLTRRGQATIVRHLAHFASDYFTDHCVYEPEIPSETGLRAYLASMHDVATASEDLELNIDSEDWEEALDEAARLGWEKWRLEQEEEEA